MSVDIEIDLDAAEAQGKIGAIAASLKGLERVADDIEIDIDEDIGELTGIIDELGEALDDLDIDSLNAARRMENAAEAIDDAELNVVHDTPDGETGDGDSTGDDPPDKGRDGDRDTRSKKAIARSRFGDIFDDVLSNEDLNLLKHDFADFAKGQDIHLTEEEKNTPLRERIFSEEFGVGLHANARGERLKEKATPPEFGSFEQFQRKKNLLLSMDKINPDFSMMEDGSFRDLNQEARRQLSTPEQLDIERNARSGPSEPIHSKRKTLADTDLYKRINNIESATDAFEELDVSQRKVVKSLGRLKPSYTQIRAIVSAFIPLLVVLGAQLLGVASAMGAVAGAGAAIIGLGLVGHGEDMASSMERAKEEVSDLKEELFEVFQGTAQDFAPVQSRIFDKIPSGLSGIADSMKGFTRFEDTLMAVGAILSNDIETAIDRIVGKEKEIGQLAVRFTEIASTNILDFFSFLFRVTFENQELLINLGKAVKDLLKILFNFSLLLSRIVAAAEPLIGVVAYLSNLFSNRLVGSVLSVLVVGALLGSMATRLTLSLMAMGKMLNFVIGRLLLIGSGSVINGIKMAFTLLNSHVWTSIASLTTLQKVLMTVVGLLSATGIGLAVVGTGLAAFNAMDVGQKGPDVSDGRGPGRPGGSGGMVYNDNRQFNYDAGSGDDYATRKQVEDINQRQMEKRKATDLPGVDTEN
jgi:hypothetical protein